MGHYFWTHSTFKLFKCEFKNIFQHVQPYLKGKTIRIRYTGKKKVYLDLLVDSLKLLEVGFELVDSLLVFSQPEQRKRITRELSKSERKTRRE